MKKTGKTTQETTSPLFDFTIDPEPLSGEVTSHAGLPVLAETFRALGGMRSANAHLNGKRRARGYTDGEMKDWRD